MDCPVSSDKCIYLCNPNPSHEANITITPEGSFSPSPVQFLPPRKHYADVSHTIFFSAVEFHIRGITQQVIFSGGSFLPAKYFWDPPMELCVPIAPSFL